jgi:hypothetical protein
MVSIILVALDLVDVVPSSWIAPVTLAVLSLLSVTILGNRYRTEQILDRIPAKGVELLQHLVQEDLDRDATRSRTLTLIGVDLQRSLHLHYSVLQEKLEQGDTIRAVLVKPEGAACGMTAMRSYQPMTNDDQRNTINQSLRMLERLGQERAGNLEIRVTDNLPAYGAYAADLDLPRGVIYMWFYRFRTQTDNQPKMVLRPEDGHWYELFREDVSNIWECATPWQGSANNEGL